MNAPTKNIKLPYEKPVLPCFFLLVFVEYNCFLYEICDAEAKIAYRKIYQRYYDYFGTNIIKTPRYDRGVGKK